MNVCTFYFKHSQSNVLFLYFFVFVFLFFTFCLELYSSFYDTLTKRAISDWIVLEVKTQERRSLEKTNQRLTLTFQWKLNKQRCNYERMRDKDVKFIHIISIATVVYSNGINLKTLMSHWRHLTTTFKISPCIVFFANLRIHKRFSSNFSQLALIRPCTLCFRVLQCSMECLKNPPW